MKLSLVIAESAMELVPKEILRSPAVVSDAKRRGVEPGRILLDRSVHHSAMLKLPDASKRGRPDLVHETLLSVTGTPLYLDGEVKVYVHCRGDKVVELAEGTRTPKSYFRFRGLMEKALATGDGGELLEVYGASVRELLQRVKPDLSIGLSVQGKAGGFEELAAELASEERPCVVVGGFPHGHFSESTLKDLDELVRVHARPLEAHVVVARLLYEVEKRAVG